MEKINVLVLGAGMVGSVIARDLSKFYNVTVADINQDALKILQREGIDTLHSDLSHPKRLERITQNFEFIVNCLPGNIGYNALKALIKLNKKIADISFFAENAIELNDLAIKYGSTVVFDIGVAPGLSNLILGQHYAKAQVEEFVCYVGGLPKERKWPFEYKAPFSPSDVIEEYTRPARIKENGKIVIKPALSEREYVFFPGIGTLEAFNSDGLRSLLFSLDVPNMKEKTLRYPGHAQLMEIFCITGLFSDDKIMIGDHQIAPRAVTEHLLRNHWQLNPEDDEFTVMKILITQNENNSKATYEYFLYDQRDRNTGFSSMSRTTGFTCAAALHLLVKNKINQTGVIAPEVLGQNTEAYDFILHYLEERNIRLSCRKLNIEESF